MEAHEYDTIRALEDTHWWHQGLWALTVKWLRRELPPVSGARVLDAGCGTGGLLQELARAYAGCAGVDLSESAVSHCRGRGLSRVVRASVEKLPFADGVFDAVVSNDVLYHREAREAPALAEFWRVMKPGGLLLMNLPALESMRGIHDVVVHTRRRFTRNEVEELLSVHGFTQQRVTYRNSLLFPAAWVVRHLRRPQLEGRPESSDLSSVSAPLNGSLAAVLRLENALLDYIDLPIGLTVFCQARKSGHP